jgi:uncharacterized protein (TIGR02271 family)
MTERNRDEQHIPLVERYSNHQVLDRFGHKIGKVDDLFVDAQDELEYIGVKMDALGTSTTLIPAEMVRLDDLQPVVGVLADKETVRGGPAVDDDQVITSEYEDHVRAYYGLGSRPDRDAQGSYGAYYSDADAETGSQAAAPGSASTGKSDLGHGEAEGEISVGRAEEELEASVHERETGGVTVRKRVRTDRERMIVPKRREEVIVERVPVEDEASETQIGEDEIRVPIFEEEVEVTKRLVQKEEIRIRKESVEEEEVIEKDVRKEEVEVDDDSERRRN